MKKNDKLFIVEGKTNDENVQKLIKEFKEELKPLHVSEKTWGK